MSSESGSSRWQVLTRTEWGAVIGLLLIFVVGLIFKYMRERPQAQSSQVLPLAEETLDR